MTNHDRTFPFRVVLASAILAGCLLTASGNASAGPAAHGDPGAGETAITAPAVSEAEEEGSASDQANADTDEDPLDAALDLVETAHEYWKDGDEARALEALDEAYRLIVSVNAGPDPKLAQQKEDLRFTISKRILEIYASRYTAAKGTHKAIPLTVNKYVEREIKMFTSRERTFFLNAYRRSGRYRGRIVKALKEAGLPEELSWLPLIESGFKIRALSRSRALGLWQFIPSTGYKYGLRRTAWIDDRMDPEKSTLAAIAYLKELHGMFGDWATVLAAYNCGEGTVLRAINRQKAGYLDNFWDLYERLPSETARYYPRFLAVLAILKDPVRYGVVLDTVDSPRQFEVVPVKKQVHLRTLANRLGVALEELTVLNPQLRRFVTPAGSYVLKVPAGKGRVVLATLDTLPRWTPPKRSYLLHRVRRGENLSLLALKYHTSVKAIKDTNQLRGKFLLVGQTLRIPVKGENERTTGT